MIISIVMFGVVGFVLYLLLSGLVGLSEGDASYYTQQIVTLLGIPLSSAVGAVLYVDLRVRKEDLDSAELTVLLSRTD